MWSASGRGQAMGGDRTRGGAASRFQKSSIAAVHALRSENKAITGVSEGERTTARARPVWRCSAFINDFQLWYERHLSGVAYLQDAGLSLSSDTRYRVRYRLFVVMPHLSCGLKNHRNKDMSRNKPWLFSALTTTMVPRFMLGARRESRDRLRAQSQVHASFA